MRLAQGSAGRSDRMTMKGKSPSGQDGADIRLQLADLKRRMEQDFAPHRLFFFPSVPKEKIAGYWGRGPVVFIAERPSNAPKARSQATHIFADRFHDVLKRHNFADAHITDLIKHVPGTGLGYRKVIDLNWPYLLEELAIVDAKLVVAVGSKVRDELQRRRLAYPTLDVPHYSYRYGAVAALREQLDVAFARVRHAADALTPTGA